MSQSVGERWRGGTRGEKRLGGPARLSVWRRRQRFRSCFVPTKCLRCRTTCTQPVAHSRLGELEERVCRGQSQMCNRPQVQARATSVPPSRVVTNKDCLRSLLHEQVLEARRRRLGADHPNTLLSANNLAGRFGQVRARWDPVGAGVPSATLASRRPAEFEVALLHRQLPGHHIDSTRGSTRRSTRVFNACAADIKRFATQSLPTFRRAHLLLHPSYALHKIEQRSHPSKSARCARMTIFDGVWNPAFAGRGRACRPRRPAKAPCAAATLRAGPRSSVDRAAVS